MWKNDAKTTRPLPDSVHRIYLLQPVLLDPVTLERILLLLHLRVGVQILDGDSPLDAAQHETLLVREAPDRPRLILQAGLPLLQRVRHVPDVPDQYLPSGRSHHQFLAAHAHRVHLVALVVVAAANRGAGVPQFQVVVPAAGEDTVYLAAVFDATDGVAVGTHGGFWKRTVAMTLCKLILLIVLYLLWY